MQTPSDNSPHPPAARPRSGIGPRLTISAAVFAVALAVGFFFVHRSRTEQEAQLAGQTSQDAGQPPMVEVVHAQAAPASLPMGLPGETHGWYQSVIYARVSGYVDKWFMDIGDHVHKGEVLATIETPDLDAQLQAAEQQFAVSQSDVLVAQANVDFANTTFQRWKDSPKGIVAPQETEEKRAAYDSGMAELKAAGSKVSAAQAEVDRLKALEGYKQVTAPYDGVITSRRVDIGDLVTAGSTSNTTPLYSIAQVGVIRVFVDVPQAVASQVVEGVTTRTTANSFPGRVFRGQVARTARAIDPESRTLKVEVDIANLDLTLMPGMYVQVSFDLKQNALVQVPAGAMMFRSSGPQVAVVGEDGRVRFRDVTIAVDNGDVVELGSGVARDDRVALNLSSQVADGEQVKVADSPSQAVSESPGAADNKGVPVAQAH